MNKGSGDCEGPKYPAKSMEESSQCGSPEGDLKGAAAVSGTEKGMMDSESKIENFHPDTSSIFTLIYNWDRTGLYEGRYFDRASILSLREESVCEPLGESRSFFGDVTADIYFGGTKEINLPVYTAKKGTTSLVGKLSSFKPSPDVRIDPVVGCPLNTGFDSKDQDEEGLSGMDSEENFLEMLKTFQSSVRTVTKTGSELVRNLKKRVQRLEEELEEKATAMDRLGGIVGQVAQFLGTEFGEQVEEDQVLEKVKILTAKLKKKERLVGKLRLDLALDDSSSQDNL